MPEDWLLLGATTAGVAFVHTLLGPDHYLPFVAMFRAGQWSRTRALRITLVCGIGHIAGSLVLGLVGVGLGISLAQFSVFESLRGTVAAWGLILFGVCYAAWGLRRAIQNRPHSHWHAHADGELHLHDHVHADEHVHFHERSRVGTVSAWTFFAVFILGPCEPLIPLLMVPAAAGNTRALVGVVTVFASVTLASMLGIVWLGTTGRQRSFALPGRRFGHALAGALVCACGLLMQFAGL